MNRARCTEDFPTRELTRPAKALRYPLSPVMLFLRGGARMGARPLRGGARMGAWPSWLLATVAIGGPPSTGGWSGPSIPAQPA